MAIRINLSKWAGIRKVKLADINRATKIRPNTLSNLWHENTKRIQIEDIEKICRFLDITPNDLFEIVDDPEEEDSQYKDTPPDEDH